jgi:DNA mismatch repair protein MutH
MPVAQSLPQSPLLAMVVPGRYRRKWGFIGMVLFNYLGVCCKPKEEEFQAVTSQSLALWQHLLAKACLPLPSHP